MRVLEIALLSLALVSPLSVSAQVGPCGSGDTCASGQICRGPEGSRLCYQTCTPPVGSATSTCPTRESCTRPEGFTEDVCTPSSSGTSSPSANPDETAEEPPFEPITPVLGVPIPGATLSDPTREGGVVRVAFLAEYINAVYRYLATIGLVVAIVMCVYGGFLYLIGSGGVGDIRRGKKIIIDSIAGMVLLLASYAILNTINPATTRLNVFELESIDRFDAALNTTRAETVDTSDAGSEPGAGSCPISLSAAQDLNNARGPRTQEFIDEMRDRLTGNDRADVRMVANAIAACDIHAGSCGNTVITVNEVVGITGRGRRTNSISGTTMSYLDTIKCASGTGATCTRPAKATAFERISSEVSGYPNSWTDDLEPGDAITVFNANSGPFGTHAAIFMGWASNGRANVVQGQWGRAARTGTICLTSSCGNPTPLVRTFSPD